MHYVAVLLLAVSLCGCSFQPQTREVRSYMPVLERPERPKLDELTPDEVGEFGKLSSGLKAKLIGNSDRLQLYSMKMEYKLDTYNEFAKAANQTSNAALGITKPESVGGGK